MLSAESDVSDTKRASDERLLSELKLQYENVLRLKEGLENRANSLVAVSATVATLLFAFGTFLYTDIEPPHQFYWIVFPVGISVGASITAMIFGIIASRVAKYALPIGDRLFFRANGLKNTENLDKYRDSTELIFLIQ
jgi:hypothetical protein